MQKNQQSKNIDGKYNFKYDRKIIFMVGNIGSGKTTFVKQLNGKYVVVSRDKLRYMIGNGEYVFHSNLEPAIWDGEIALFIKLLTTGINIVIDEVNTNKFMRSRYLQEIHDCEIPYTKIAVLMPWLSKRICVDRRMADPHGNFTEADWSKVWEKFDSQSIRPTEEEGFDLIVSSDNPNVFKEINEI